MSFAAAFAAILRYEGVHNVDSGGDTWYGISRDAHPEIQPWPPSDSQVSLFYHNEWNDSGAMHVPEPADVPYFLAWINMPSFAVRCLQRAVRANGVAIVDDGHFGLKTLTALGKIHGETLAAALRSEAAGQYRIFVLENHADGIYLNGWLKRAYEEPL